MRFKLVESTFYEDTSNQKFYIDPRLIEERAKSIGVQVCRIDGIVLPTKIWLPRSQCIITRRDPFIVLTIPNWLYKKDFRDNNLKIFTGY